LPSFLCCLKGERMRLVCVLSSSRRAAKILYCGASRMGNQKIGAARVVSQKRKRVLKCRARWHEKKCIYANTQTQTPRYLSPQLLLQLCLFLPSLSFLLARFFFFLRTAVTFQRKKTTASRVGLKKKIIFMSCSTPCSDVFCFLRSFA
jgi:hypothetical protein